MAKLSIIVPVFNMEKYIERCLDSLVNQTLNDIEIIIVNDGSYDKSKEIIQKYLKKYISKIKYFEKQNGGLSSARNYGIKYAKGEYIAFLDSDDYVEINMYEEMYNLAKQENSDIVECDFIWEWEKEGESREQNILKKIKYDKRRDYKNKKEMMKRPRVIAWNKLIKREIIEKNNIIFPEGLIYEDLEFFYKLIPYVNRISYINKYFVHYVQREDSISNKQTENNEDIFQILNNIFKFYKETGLYKEYENQLKYMKKRILLGSSMKRTLKIKDEKLRRKMFFKTIVYLLSSNFIFSKDNLSTQHKFKRQVYEKQENQRKKLCLGITKLGIGGAERVLVDVVNELQKDYDITIFTIYAGGE